MMNLIIRYNKPHLVGKAIAHVKYIANRAGVDYSFLNNKMGDFLDRKHGLFDLNGTANYKAYIKELEAHQGVVYRGYFGLSKEEAANLDFTDKKTWSNFLNNNIQNFSKALNIPLSNLRVVAAYHPEGTTGHNPHVHFVIWEKEPQKQQDFEFAVSKNDLEKLRWSLNKSLYRTDEIIQDKNIARDKLLGDLGELLSNRPLNKRELNNISKGFAELLNILPTKGRLSYKYMPSDVKAKLNSLCGMFLKTPALAEHYAKFLGKTEEYLKTMGASSEKIKESVENAKEDIGQRMANHILREAKAVLDGAPNPAAPTPSGRAQGAAAPTPSGRIFLPISPMLAGGLLNQPQPKSGQIFRTIFGLHGLFKSIFSVDMAELHKQMARERRIALSETTKHRENISSAEYYKTLE